MDEIGKSLDEHENESSGGSGLYVDIENLHSSSRTVIRNLVENWPDKAPAPSRLTLYVRANRMELWRLWAVSRFSNLKVIVNGTQHFSMSSTKNSADIAIATKAMADLIVGRVSHVVVISDDSDFISLYASIRDEPEIPLVDGKVPFLWIVTGREGSLSTTVREFFPPDELHVVSVEGDDSQLNVASEESFFGWTDMAKAVVEGIPIGPFKSTDCQPVIKERWPDHPMAETGGSQFGIEFKNNIWPTLESLGVKISNPGKKPVQYEMTPEAKKTSR